MISMKRTPKKSVPSLRPTMAGEEEKYPYGLHLTLEKEELDKLGISIKEYSVKDKIDFKCSATINSISASDDINYDNGSRESISLQITDIGIEPKQMKKKF